MKDKERLEEAKKLVEDYKEHFMSNDVILTWHGMELINWLIKRVQELEVLVEEYKIVNKELHQRGRKVRKQNQRYREALEYYGYEAGYTDDDGIKARKALEGEE